MVARFKSSCFPGIALGVAILSFAAMSNSGWATPESVLTEKLGGTSLLAASPASLQEVLAASCASDPAHAGAYVGVALKSRNDADAISSGVVASSIRALGPQASKRQVAEVVYNAVRVAPESVLDIVHEAVLAAPANATEDIVTAAVAAVPDPYKEVVYRKIEHTDSENAQKARLGEGKDVKDFKDLKDSKDSKSAPPEEGQRMPLAEAIARTAADARPGTDPTALMASIDYALAHGIQSMFDAIASPEKISGVGYVGDPNYANEPNLRVVERAKRASEKDPTPTPTPKGRQLRPDIPPVSL